MRWVGNDELGLVARTRWLCYGQSASGLANFEQSVRRDERAVSGDYVLAELAGQPVGTATSLSMTMWVRGVALPCQGVRYVGTIKTHRRKGANSPGVASAIMAELLNKAREREQVISALEPFRASFYEHFGYGLVERRAQWTIPLSLLPDGTDDGWALGTAADLQAQAACGQRQARAGQCEIERTIGGWNYQLAIEDGGMRYVHRGGGAVDAYVYMVLSVADGHGNLTVEEWGADSPAAFGKLLGFLGSLRDQYHSVKISLPVDLPLNLLLRQSHVPPQARQYTTARLVVSTLMQVRILDHQRFLQQVSFGPAANGRAVLAIHEPEGQTSRLNVEVDNGKANVAPAAASPSYECPAKTWASIACGELPASTALRMGLATGQEKAADLLDHLARGPRPFCHEYF
jgi:predicted acetyltransferase